MSAPGVIRNLPDGRLGVWVPYAFKDRVKAIPGSRWHPDLKCWSVPPLFRAEAQALIGDINSQYDSARDGGHNTDLPVDIDQLIAALLSTIPRRLIKPTHRALAKAWHPDSGGDKELMQSLNRAVLEAVPA